MEHSSNPESITVSLEEATLDLVRRHLADELRDDSASVKARAENLIAIAKYFDREIMPELIQWIHERAPGKQWTAAEWRRFCLVQQHQQHQREESRQ